MVLVHGFIIIFILFEVCYVACHNEASKSFELQRYFSFKLSVSLFSYCMSTAFGQ